MTTQVIEQPITEVSSQPIEVLAQPTLSADERPVARRSLADIRHRITVAEYHRMNDAGVFGPSPRIELLEGVIVDKMTKNTPHIIATDKIEDLLHFLFPRGSAYCITMGNPVTIVERDGEPEPDAMLVRGAIDDYLERRRTPADIVLTIEVSETSYDTDRFIKWPIYAATRIPVYWIVDLNHDRLEVHTEPEGQGESAIYTKCIVYDKLDQDVPFIIDGREIARFPLIEILPIKKLDPNSTTAAQPE